MNDFFVDPGHRRKGIGRSLVNKILGEARAMRVDRVVLEVLPRNSEAVAFWKAVGFSTEGRTVFSKELG